LDNSTTSLTIIRVPLDSLHLDPSNARLHPERNLEAIKGSLARFGQVEPLVVQKGTRRIIGGNGRLVAMRELGFTHADVVEVEIDDHGATALGIALNRSGSLGEWDVPALAALLDSLRAEGALDGVGYTESEIDELLADLDQGGGALIDDPGPAEPPANPVTRLGDMWILGEQIILCGDSTKRADIQRVLQGEKAALLSSDPPYAVSYTGNDRPIHDGKPSGKDWSHLYHETDIKDLGVFMDGVFAACLRDEPVEPPADLNAPVEPQPEFPATPMSVDSAEPSDAPPQIADQSEAGPQAVDDPDDSED
jgi:hypothetical protein